MDTLIVGAGFAGATTARLLAEAGERVLVIDKRPHIAGNAHDRRDAAGLLVHSYGPHIFHTNSEKVFAFLSRFTAWRPYEHRVLAVPDARTGRAYPMPINRTTINRLYGLNLDEAGTADFLERVREPRSTIRTSEDVVLNSVGRDLCEKFFRGYTRKQWGLDLSELAGGVAARIPTRTNDDDRYFTDRFQAMPQVQQDHTFGRRISDNEEIDDAPLSAHVKRTAQEDFDPEAFVLRRSMPWSDSERSGLVFVAFGHSFDAFEALLHRMVGKDDGIIDALFSFTHPVTGCYFWCPPVSGDDIDLSAIGL